VNHATHPTPLSSRLQAAEARLALRLSARLGEQAERAPHDIAERLRFAREQAVARARVSRAPVRQAAPVQVSGGPAATLAGPPSWWLRLASVLPLVVLTAGLVLIQHVNTRDEIAAAAEVDAALLADELPPAAYSDPGFVAFLKAPAAF
jgi:hypothetical protein